MPTSIEVRHWKLSAVVCGEDTVRGEKIQECQMPSRYCHNNELMQL